MKICELLFRVFASILRYFFQEALTFLIDLLIDFPKVFIKHKFIILIFSNLLKILD